MSDGAGEMTAEDVWVRAYCAALAGICADPGFSGDFGTVSKGFAEEAVEHWREWRDAHYTSDGRPK